MCYLFFYENVSKLFRLKKKKKKRTEPQIKKRQNTVLYFESSSLTSQNSRE